MSYSYQNNYTIDDDITLTLCIDLILSRYNKRNKDRVRKRLQEIFIFSKITDYIMLKDALWISDNFSIPLFYMLDKHSEKYLEGHLIEHVDEFRKVFGRRTKNEEYHLNFQNFRLLFIHSVLSTICELLKSKV